jgi:hypothetical protein
VQERDPFVIETERLQNRGVNIGHMRPLFNAAQPDFVRLAEINRPIRRFFNRLRCKTWCGQNWPVNFRPTGSP